MNDDDKGKRIRLTRYEDAIWNRSDEGARSDVCVEHTEAQFAGPLLTGRTRWHLRLWYWWYMHRPHLHFGPCDDGGEE